MEEIKLEVLWIDDEPSEPFIDEAYNEGINITNCEYLNDGIRQLKDGSKVWDAIILDANCKVSGVEVEPSISALYKAIKYLMQERITTPWFVYTAKGIDWSEELKNLINDETRLWDDRDYYNKPSQRYDLFSNIKKAVAKKEEYTIRNKYAAVCNYYKDFSLVDILMKFENGTINTDPDIPNKVREVLDWIMKHLNAIKVLPVLFNGTNINECSVCLGMMSSFVPKHVQRSFHSCVEISNEGSHRDIRQLLKSGDAPYLNLTLVANLLNILYWCSTIPNDPEKTRKRTIEEYTNHPNVVRYGTINKTSEGILKLDNILVMDKSIKEGDIVACIKGKKENRYIKLAYI